MFDPENVVNMDVDKDKGEYVDKNMDVDKDMGMGVNMDMVDKTLCSVGPGIRVLQVSGKHLLAGLCYPNLSPSPSCLCLLLPPCLAAYYPHLWHGMTNYLLLPNYWLVLG